MGKYNIVFTAEEKEILLEELLKRLKSGENKNLHLAKELGIAKTTVRRFRQILIDER